MGSVWCVKLNNPLIPREIIAQDTKLMGLLLKGLAGLTLSEH